MTNKAFLALLLALAAIVTVSSHVHAAAKDRLTPPRQETLLQSACSWTGRKRKCKGCAPGDAVTSCRLLGQDRGCGIAHSERGKCKRRRREQSDTVASGRLSGQHRGCGVAHSERRRRKCQGCVHRDAAASCRLLGQDRRCGIAHSERRRSKCLKRETLKRY